MREMAVKSQGVVLVVMDLSKDVSSSTVSWALGNVSRHGDLLRLVGIITHVPNPSKLRKQENIRSVGRFCADVCAGSEPGKKLVRT